MKRRPVLALSAVTVLLFVLSACTLTPGQTKPESVSIAQVLSSPEEYEGKNITVEGYLFSGWEWFGIAEDYKFERQTAAQSVGGWITLHGEPKNTAIDIERLRKHIAEVKDRLYVENYADPESLFGKVRVTGEFQLLGDKGQYGQLAPIEMELLPWLPPPSSALPQGELKISKAPALDETAELTFDFYGKSSAFGLAGDPPVRAWVEFERYDPTLYYPLGKIGRKIDKFVSWDYEKSAAPGFRDSVFPTFLEEASADQPETSVPASTVLVDGSLEWQSPPSDVPDRVQLSANVRFPDEGWWVMSGWMAGDTWQAEIYDYILLTVARDEGSMGWPQDIDANMVNPYHPVSPGEDVLVYASVPIAPLVNEPFALEVMIERIGPYTPLASASIKVFKRVQQQQTMSDWKQEVPIGDLLVEGKAEWQGELRQGAPVRFKTALKLPEGDWWIALFGGMTPSSSMERQRILLHVGKNGSWYAWPAQFPYSP